MLAGERLALEDRAVRNIVFMGMGEPFHNEEAVYEAIAALLAPELFHYPPRRILDLDRRHPRRDDPRRPPFPTSQLRPEPAQRPPSGPRDS